MSKYSKAPRELRKINGAIYYGRFKSYILRHFGEFDHIERITDKLNYCYYNHPTNSYYLRIKFYGNTVLDWELHGIKSIR